MEFTHKMRNTIYQNNLSSAKTGRNISRNLVSMIISVIVSTVLMSPELQHVQLADFIAEMTEVGPSYYSRLVLMITCVVNIFSNINTLHIWSMLSLTCWIDYLDHGHAWADCCDGSDEYDGGIICLNTCYKDVKVSDNVNNDTMQKSNRVSLEDFVEKLKELKIVVFLEVAFILMAFRLFHRGMRSRRRWFP